MNYFTKKRLVIWTVIILVVLNISALATILYERNLNCSPSPIQKADENQRFREINWFMREDLGLNPSQTNKIYRLRRKNYLDSRKILLSLDDKRKEMLTELQKEHPDQKKLNEIAVEIGNLHSDLKMVTIQYFLNIKKICSPEQQVKLNKLFRDMEYYHEHKNRGRNRHGNIKQGTGHGSEMRMKQLHDSTLNK
jgi:Spy/CpxP family protein refolding chaperone